MPQPQSCPLLPCPPCDCAQILSYLLLGFWFCLPLLCPDLENKLYWKIYKLKGKIAFLDGAIQISSTVVQTSDVSPIPRSLWETKLSLMPFQCFILSDFQAFFLHWKGDWKGIFYDCDLIIGPRRIRATVYKLWWNFSSKGNILQHIFGMTLATLTLASSYQAKRV